MATSSTDDLLDGPRDHTLRRRLPWILFALALVAGGVSTLVLARRVERARVVAAVTASNLRAANVKLGETRSANDELKATLARMESERADLLVAKGVLSSTVQAKEDELARLKATFEELQEKMKAEIAKGEIRLSESNGRLKVDLVDKILFDSGDATISRRGKGVLARVGAILSRVQDRQIQVAGHTDDAPITGRLVERYATNWELSASRATNVVRFLQDAAHVPPERLAATGYGPFHPIAPNATAAGRARNRRIEILLTPALDPAASQMAAAMPAAKASRVRPTKPRPSARIATSPRRVADGRSLAAR